MSDADNMRKKWAAMIGPAKVSPEAVKEARAVLGLDPGVRAAEFFSEMVTPPQPMTSGRTLH